MRTPVPILLIATSLSLLAGDGATLRAAEEPVEVRGGKTLSTREVRSRLPDLRPGAPLDREGTRRALADLGQKLVAEGYLEAQILLILPSEEQPARVEVIEGTQALWDTVRVFSAAPTAASATATAAAAAARLPVPALSGSFDPARFDALLWDWCDRWTENGHPFAEARIESLVVREGRVRAGLRLDPGPYLEVRELRFPGRTSTRESFLHRWLRFRPGRPYRESEWRGRLRRLEQSELFGRVGEPVLEILPATGSPGGETARAPALRIWMPVEETRHNRMEAALGLSGNSGRLSGFADLDLGNLFGTGRQVGFRWDRLQKDQSRLHLRFREPLLGPLPVGLRGSLEQEERDSTYTRLVAELLLETAVGWDLTAFAGGEYHRSLIGREPSERILRASSIVGGRWETVRPGRWRGGRLEGVFRSGRSRIRPPSGGPSHSLRLNRADLESERYWPLGDVLVLRTTVTAAALSPPDSLPPSEALRLGGGGTVRGYAEEEFASRRFGAAQLELGLGLPRERIYLFADGALYRPFGGRERSADLWGIGIGLASETASRRVALDLGMPRGGSLREGRLHLRVETRF